MHFIAHRGNDKHLYRENTIKALNECLAKEYILGVELDIRFTKDKKIVIYHNMLLNDGNILVRINNKTLKQVKQIDKNIASLEEFLSQVKTKKIILIEIKEERSYFDDFIISLANLLKKYRYLNLYLCSFNYKLLKKLKNKYPNYKCGLIIGYLMNTKNIDKNFDFFLYSYNYIDLINYEKEIFIFTINNIDKLNRVKSSIKNTYYIISDKSYLFS